LNGQKPLPTESLVIQKYLQGESMNQISKETHFSKGKIHYLIKNWKGKINESDLDEVRDFSSLVKRSSISIEQCAQGFRMLNILKSIGIIGNLEVVDDNDYNNESKDIDNHINNDNFNQLTSFIEEIYNNCKKLEISPTFIALWIKDLIDCQPLIDINKTEPFEIDEIIEQPIISNQEQQQEEDSKDLEAPINKGIKYSSLIDNEKSIPFRETSSSKFNSNQSRNYFTSDIKVPFVSQVSFFIAKKRKEIYKLNNHQKSIEKNIQSLKEQERKTKNDLNTIAQKQRFLASYIKWFISLEQSLRQNYNIEMKQDIQSFCQLINDFKEKGYSVDAIVQEYLKSISLKGEVKTNEDKIQFLQGQISQLTKQVSFLESQINQHKITLDKYSYLEAMGFGIKELNQLWNNLLEISEANEISHRDAVSKFLKDIEEQYDSKLGFEKKVNEKRTELVLINRELNNSRQNLFLNPLVGSSLFNLLQRGIVEQDITNINQLVENVTTKDIIDKVTIEHQQVNLNTGKN